MVIELKNISKSYNKGKAVIPVLQKFSEVFESGNLYLIKGVSGKGKTTLLSLIGLLDSPTSGEIWLNNHRVDNQKEQQLCKLRRELFSFVFQDYGLLENLSVIENILLPLQEAEVHISETALDATLEKLNMLHRKYHRVADLSGGEKQRIAFARALVRKSEVFICDETVSNIDAENEAVILQILDELRKDRIVIASCHTSSMDSLCNKQINL